VPPATGMISVFIDDMPITGRTEGAYRGSKQLFSGRRCTVIFQPHFFRAQRDFADAFAESLDMGG